VIPSIGSLIIDQERNTDYDRSALGSSCRPSRVMVARSNILKKRRPSDSPSPGYRSYCTAVQSLLWNAKITQTLDEEPASLQGEDKPSPLLWTSFSVVSS